MQVSAIPNTIRSSTSAILAQTYRSPCASRSKMSLITTVATAFASDPTSRTRTASVLTNATTICNCNRGLSTFSTFSWGHRLRNEAIRYTIKSLRLPCQSVDGSKTRRLSHAHALKSIAERTRKTVGKIVPAYTCYTISYPLARLNMVYHNSRQTMDIRSH